MPRSAGGVIIVATSRWCPSFGCLEAAFNASQVGALLQLGLPQHVIMVMNLIWEICSVSEGYCVNHRLPILRCTVYDFVCVKKFELLDEILAWRLSRCVGIMVLAVLRLHFEAVKPMAAYVILCNAATKSGPGGEAEPEVDSGEG